MSENPLPGGWPLKRNALESVSSRWLRLVPQRNIRAILVLWHEERRGMRLQSNSTRKCSLGDAS